MRGPRIVEAERAVPRTAVAVRPGTWRRRVNTGVALNFSYDFARQNKFAGAFVHHDLGALATFAIACRPHTVRRGAEDLALPHDPAFVLTLQVDGHKRVTQEGRATTLKAGDFALYDSERPLAMDIGDGYRSVNVRFRKAALGAHDTEAFAGLVARKFSAEKGLAPVFWSAALTLGAAARSPGAIVVAGHVLDIAATMLRTEADAGAPADALTRRREAVLAYIDAHLEDPGLRVDTIAAAHFVSVRSLHSLFRGSGHTVAGWIRHRRVAECRRDLADPAQRTTPVAAIGARWGFTSASHFGQVFKDATGLPPAEFREAVV
ncbi:helix-turn-helix domain-containing protein [Amycolatopsis sp. NPDC004368]